MPDHAYDCSYSYPGAAAVANDGAVGLIRYLSWEPGKNWAPWQVTDCQSHGLGLGVVWETYARRPAEGHRAGSDDAGHANDQADRLGWPGDRPIYYAVDFDTGPDVVRAYFEGAVSRGGRPVGAYGSYAVIEGIVGGGVVGWGWQCAAWSGYGSGTGGSIASGGETRGRRVSAHAHLFQKVGYVLGQSCDANVILKSDWGQWGDGVVSGPTFKVGDAGPDVEAVQRLVRAPVTGTYDDATAVAVRSLQALVNLELTGVWDPLTAHKVGDFLRYIAWYVDHEEELNEMPTYIVDGRPDRLSAWLLGPDSKTFIPGLDLGPNDYPALAEAAAASGKGGIRLPDDGPALQGAGSPWIMRLDLAPIANPDMTPQRLGGNRPD